MTLTPAQFRALAGLLFPDGWRAGAAAFLGVSVRNVEFWAAEPPSRCKAVPPGVVCELLAEARRRMGDPAEAARMTAVAERQASILDILRHITGREKS